MKTKKIFASCAAFLLSALCSFSKEYTVKSVSGKVRYEAVDGIWKKVNVGDRLSSSSFVNVGVGSKIVLTCEGKTFSIKPLQKGTLENLCEASKPVSGIKRSGGPVKSSVASASTKTSKGVSTAAARGKNSDDEDEWNDFDDSDSEENEVQPLEEGNKDSFSE